MAAACLEVWRLVAASGLPASRSRFPCLYKLASCFGSHQEISISRKVHCSHGAALMCVKPEPNKTTEELDREEPEYIPKKKAQNPMKKIGYAWMIGLPSGIIGFILAKREVDKNRLKQLKIRQRMKRANEGDYESERYKPAH
ncbi:hypothetical protein GJAV_G00203020 [Gymnothorax javanicus]|nr:hypothetical protein GJAV_G00203020 [Gymnothorax javanicus]